MASTGRPKSAAADSADVAARLRLSAARLGRQLRQRSNVGLTPSQFSALSSIARLGSPTLGDLALRERVSRPTITNVVRKLIDAELVVKEVDPDDRRVWVVRTTDEGDALLDATRERRDAWLTLRLESLSAVHRRQLAAALDALDALVEPEPEP